MALAEGAASGWADLPGRLCLPGRGPGREPRVLRLRERTGDTRNQRDGRSVDWTGRHTQPKRWQVGGLDRVDHLFGERTGEMTCRWIRQDGERTGFSLSLQRPPDSSIRTLRKHLEHRPTQHVPAKCAGLRGALTARAPAPAAPTARPAGRPGRCSPSPTPTAAPAPNHRLQFRPPPLAMGPLTCTSSALRYGGCTAPVIFHVANIDYHQWQWQQSPGRAAPCGKAGARRRRRTRPGRARAAAVPGGTDTQPAGQRYLEGWHSCEQETSMEGQVHFQSTENGPVCCECFVCVQRSARPLPQWLTIVANHGRRANPIP